MINILTSIAVWSIIFLCFIRFLYFAGVPINQNKYTKYFLKKPDVFFSDCPTKKDYFKIALSAFLFRIFIYIISILIMILFLDGIQINLEEFLNQWTKWDSYHYIKIALNGYSNSIEDGKHLFLVFFPLYPWCIRFLNFFIGNIQIAGLLISNICYIIGCCYFYGFVSFEYGKEIAKKSVIYFSVFPFSFFLGGIETESLFFLLLTACFYYMQRHKWVLAGILGFLASLTRMTGILLIIPALVEWSEYTKPFQKICLKKCFLFFKHLSGIFIMCFGPLIYLYINYLVDKNPFQFLKYQREHWYQVPQYFGKTVTQLWERAFLGEAEGFIKAAVWIPDILLFFFALLLLFYAVRKHQNKYVIFLVFYLVINYSPSWLLSGGRYMSLAIPIFLFIGEFAEKHQKIHTWIVAVFSLLLGIYLTGFLMGKQIM